MRYIQDQPYGCGLYAVSNALNIYNFLTDERLNESKTGNVIGQLSKWMQDDGMNMYIDALYYDHLGEKLPESAFGYVPIGEDGIMMPILLNVRLSEGGLNHMVGGRISKNGTLHLYDSLKLDMIVTKLSEVNNLYHNVYGLFIFMDLKDGSYVFI